MTSDEQQIAATLATVPDGNRITYVNYDGSTIRVFFDIVEKETLPEAALQAKGQVKDILQTLIQVGESYSYTQASLIGSYPLPAAAGQAAPAQKTVVVEVTYTFAVIDATDWGNLPPEPVYDSAQSRNIHPRFEEAGR